MRKKSNYEYIKVHGLSLALFLIAILLIVLIDIIL